MGRIVVVSGLPGAGKTTVGRALADRLDLAFVDKDDVLEALFERDDDPAAHRQALSRRADDLVVEQVDDRPVVVVSFWRREELSSTSGTPTGWLAPAEVVEVWCDCPVDVAHGRFFARRRHAGHGDDRKDRDETRRQLERLAELGPLGIGTLVRVDTSGAVDLDALADQVRTVLASDAARR